MLKHEKECITGSEHSQPSKGAVPAMFVDRKVHTSRKRRSATEKSESSLPLSVSFQNPCSILHCYKDTIVNCTGLLLSKIVSSWFPKNVTAIFLDYNNFEIIENTSFSLLTNIRILSLSNNKINKIEEHSFAEMRQLESLNLESNKLSEISFPDGLLDPLHRLKDLRLAHNNWNYGLPQHVINHLKNLNVLTLDSAEETFTISQNLTNLSTLKISGKVEKFDHTSFLNVTSVSRLILEDLFAASNFTDTALRPLVHIDSLEISHWFIDLNKTLQSVKPLAGKNMTSIALYKVTRSSHGKYASLYTNDAILDAKKTKHLMNICVRDFSLVESHIFVVKSDAFFSPLWDKCLINLDLSKNPLIGSRLTIFALINLKSIETLSIENANGICSIRNSFSRRNNFPLAGSSGTIESQLTCYSTNLHTLYKNINVSDHAVTHNILRALTTDNLVEPSSEVRTEEGKFASPVNDVSCSSELGSEDADLWGYLRIYMSESLKYMKISNTFGHSQLGMDIHFIGATNLIYFDMSDGLVRNFQINVKGLGALKTLMISANDASVLSETFFDGMCHLEELQMSSCNLNATFMSNQSARLFRNLLDLKRVDLSSNYLTSLSPETFARNILMEELDLSNNRFQNIPFNLKNTPRLKILDLCDNSIITLESHETDEMDGLVMKHAAFKLRILGNILSCGCNNFRFLVWLQTTHVGLDDVRNCACINDEGQLSYLRDVAELDSLWRKCWGKTLLSMSIILLCITVIGFLLVVFVWKNKTLIYSKLLQIFTGYRLNNIEDYPTGVFIGYAENDYHFPCFVLRRFIEEEMNLTTYVYNRDNVADCDRASSIADAINASWRIILLVSEDFLCHDEWAMFTGKTAIYSLSPANPARVVVLVQENLQHRLPLDVLSVVAEENIIVLSSWKLSDDLKTKLRTLLKGL